MFQWSVLAGEWLCYTCIFEYLLLQLYNKLVPEINKKYIDDIGATSMNYNQLLDFINFVQNFHPAVKFTYHTSETSITFLDINISLKQWILSTCIYYKTADSHSCLDYRSSHNRSTKNSIPFPQFVRLRRLYSNDAYFEKTADGMTDFFINRHYPNNIIQIAIDLVKLIPRQQILQPKPYNSCRKKTDLKSPVPTLDNPCT